MKPTLSTPPSLPYTAVAEELRSHHELDRSVCRAMSSTGATRIIRESTRYSKALAVEEFNLFAYIPFLSGSIT